MEAEALSSYCKQANNNIYNCISAKNNYIIIQICYSKLLGSVHLLLAGLWYYGKSEVLRLPLHRDSLIPCILCNTHTQYITDIFEHLIIKKP